MRYVVLDSAIKVFATLFRNNCYLSVYKFGLCSTRIVKCFPISSYEALLSLFLTEKSKLCDFHYCKVIFLKVGVFRTQTTVSLK